MRQYSVNIKPTITLVFVSLIYVFNIANSYSQEAVKGFVYKASDSTAILGASVYFDGTSIGASTTIDGEFELPFKQNNSFLVISAIGYSSLAIDLNDDRFKDKNITIYLDEKLEELEAVQLEVDTWSRKKKLRIFKSQFIGKYPVLELCDIKNEDDIRLKYIPSSNLLVASAREPLIIKNKYLGYKITYNLVNFEVAYKKNENGLNLPYSTYFEGYSYFEPLRNKTSNKVKENRTKSYLGSSLHFFRSIYSERIDENNFGIFNKGFLIPTYRHLIISKEGEFKKVSITAEEIGVLYENGQQSSLKAKSVFNIDSYGNHFPPDAITIGGDMSKKRMAELLPLNYKMEN